MPSRAAIVATSLLLLLVSGCESSKPATAQPTQASSKLSPEMRKADLVYAYVDAMREDLSDGKAHIYNQVMRLTPEESKIFWPIYHDYEDELFTLGDQRVELTRGFANAMATRSLDDSRAATLTDEWFKFETQRLELLKKYQKQIASDLSPLRAAQFAQIEHRVSTVIDLAIASELPLVSGRPRLAADARPAKEGQP